MSMSIITKPITRMIEEENLNLDEIAEAVCPQIEYGREKIIRIIKDFLGEAYLIQRAETLKYDIQKAQLAKKRKHKSHKKINAAIDNESKEHNDRVGVLVDVLRQILKEYSYSLIDLKKALAEIEMQGL